jgi:hypothetical protein
MLKKKKLEGMILFRSFIAKVGFACRNNKKYQNDKKKDKERKVGQERQKWVP